MDTANPWVLSQLALFVAAMGYMEGRDTKGVKDKFSDVSLIVSHPSEIVLLTQSVPTLRSTDVHP
jgi:hypothetical protein